MTDLCAEDDVDVAVVGAGPAGSATARWLAMAGRSVTLLERSRFDSPRVGESLAPSVQPLLRHLGLWDAFTALTPLPSYGTRGFWGDTTPQTHSHLMSPWGCGWHIDRLAFDRMMAAGAETAGAQLFQGTACTRCESIAGGWALTLRQRGCDASDNRLRRLRARFVVDATGRAARLARSVGGSRIVFDHLVAIATRFDRDDGDEQTYVMVEAAANGWWYTAPIPGRRMIAMLMTDSDLCGRDNLATQPVWYSRLREAAATHQRLADSKAFDGPHVSSAMSQRLQRHEGRLPWLAVGDAALAVDPISGSGVVRALSTARAAAETVIELLDNPAAGVIEAYEADRDRECGSYLDERASYYGVEQRWPQAAFWQRRTVMSR